MTFSAKRSPRYILPAFPPLALIAAFGWLKLYQLTNKTSRPPHATSRRLTFYILRFTSLFPAILFLSALAILLPYTPYYFTYFNPLLGGSYTAPGLVKIGWGEGLDRVGRFLQREFSDSRVGTAYASTVAPFFKGHLSGLSGDNLDYVVLYRKQLQSGRPSPTFNRYFEQSDSIFSVNLNGVHYADVYPGPALQPAMTLIPGLDAPILPQPLAFRALTPYGRIGQSLEVDVLWLADEPLPVTPSTVTLESISVFDFLSEGRDHHHSGSDSKTEQEITSLAEGQGRLTHLAGDLIVSRHHMLLPPELERGLYALLVDGRPLGEVELRHFQIPANMRPANDFVFGQQISLAAFQFTPDPDYIGLTIAWQAQKSHLPDYTVFVQLLEAETNERVAGVDSRPLNGEWPTSRWVKNEVVVDEYLVAVPPDLKPGFYKIIAGLYQPETGRRLVLADGQDFWTLPWTFIYDPNQKQPN